MTLTTKILGGLILILIGVIITLFLLLRSSNIKKDNFKTLYNDCLSAPIVTTSEVKPVTAVGGQTISPSPQVKKQWKPVLPVGDSTGQPILFPTSPEENLYTEESKIGDSINVWWKAIVTGTIDSFTLDSIHYPQRTNNITKTVLVKEPVTPEKSHIWAYAKPQASIAPFKVTGITGGIIYTYRGKWGIGAGVGYQWTYNKPVIEATILLNLK